MAPVRRSTRSRVKTATAPAATAAPKKEAATAPRKKTAAPKKKATAASKKKTTAAAPKKKKTPAKKAATTPTKKKRRTGLKTAVDASAGALGVVDPESGITGGSIENLDGEPCDAMLVLVDPQKHMDKFFIIQLIDDTKDNDRFVVYTRWGRTGTSGQALEQSFEDSDDAAKCFRDKFKSKTGLDWTDRLDPTVGNKYRFIKQNFDAKRAGYSSAKWQYWVDDGVDGKSTGWYDYDSTGSVKVEQLFQECSINPRLHKVSHFE